MEFSCAKCPGLLLRSQGEKKKHKTHHKNGQKAVKCVKGAGVWHGNVGGGQDEGMGDQEAGVGQLAGGGGHEARGGGQEAGGGGQDAGGGGQDAGGGGQDAWGGGQVAGGSYQEAGEGGQEAGARFCRGSKATATAELWWWR